MRPLVLAAAGSCNHRWARRTKGGSGFPRAWGGILGQKPELWHVYGGIYSREEIQLLLEVSSEARREKYTGFFFLLFGFVPINITGQS
jgi:hypothetical protein